MARIRLRRVGAKKKPLYRIIVVDRHKDGLGDVIETIGSYDNRSNPKIIKINKERVSYWLEKGAQPTETVKNLLRKEKIDVN